MKENIITSDDQLNEDELFKSYKQEQENLTSEEPNINDSDEEDFDINETF